MSDLNDSQELMLDYEEEVNYHDGGSPRAREHGEDNVEASTEKKKREHGEDNVEVRTDNKKREHGEDHSVEASTDNKKREHGEDSMDASAANKKPDSPAALITEDGRPSAPHQ